MTNESEVFGIPMPLIVVFILAVSSMLSGCKAAHAPMTNTIINRSDSPDSDIKALLVQRDYKAALSNDEFYLILVNDSQDVSKAINDEDIDQSSVLVATLAQHVRLHWQDSKTLVVICDRCGLEPVDISKKLDHFGLTKIVFEGFPEHTAYS